MRIGVERRGVTGCYDGYSKQNSHVTCFASTGGCHKVVTPHDLPSKEHHRITKSNTSMGQRPRNCARQLRQNMT